MAAPEEQRVESDPAAPSALTETADPSAPAWVREVFRAKHRLSVLVMERPAAVSRHQSLPAFLATTSASALADSHLRGYGDGLTRGVNRALRITPEVEQEMWNELRQAKRLDASWRRVHEAPPGDGDT